ncbi:MAG: HAD family hydrolase [Bacilli bacterium]|nr:HAD family hydrolase [Bacilli bacterium]
MKKNKLILFDWGNIVEVTSFTKNKYTCNDAFQDLFKACGYKGDKIIFKNLGSYKISSIPNIKKFEKTFNEIKKEFNLNVDFKKFVELYNYYFDKIDYYKDVRDYEVSLKDKCYIGIFSNLTIFDKKRLDKQVGLNNYDYVFLSFELNDRKPSQQIYETVSKKVPFSNEDILFIDDRQDNIEMAKNIGWNTLQATGLELDIIKEECEKFINN